MYVYLLSILWAHTLFLRVRISDFILKSPQIPKGFEATTRPGRRSFPQKHNSNTQGARQPLLLYTYVP